MKTAGIIFTTIAIIAILAVGIYLLIGKLKEKGFGIKKSAKAELPKTKVDGDNIKVKFVVDELVTVFNYDTNEKKLTVKGKEKDTANGIKAIKAADGTVYFCVEDTGKLYQLNGKKIVDVFDKDEFDDDEDDWD